MWVQRIRQALGFPTPPTFAKAAMALGLEAGAVARLETVLDRLQTTDPQLVDRLHKMVAHGRRFDAQYSALAASDPDVLSEARLWLVELVLRALDEDRGNWAALYLFLNHRELLCRYSDHKRNPQRPPRTPSAFVYAMQ